ncbi:winged helix-turn-helix domain-containing protein, partial [Corynebacterium accolens]|uniref:winged helix-turn-helix domain-containing protein n=1 Tax=Corynebacterium accolens TaxID=38284 RepID=UPI002543ECAB
MPLRLDPADTRALPVQIAAVVRADVTSGALLPGEPVPSTRALATQLGVSRGSVVTAYEQLTAEGYLSAQFSLICEGNSTQSRGTLVP